MSKKEGKLIVLSGPSGVGKSSLSSILSRQPGFVMSVSATTRPPRQGEEHGIDYFFLSEEEFKRRISARGFIEHARVFGHLYGTPRDAVRDLIEKGLHVVLDVDVQGGASIKEQEIPSLLFFILPPSLEELEARLRGRKTEKETQISQRLKEVEKEMSFQDRYDFTIVNDSLERALEEILEIIKKNENGGKRVS